MMKIEMHNIRVSDLAEGYLDLDEEGVRGYSGRLNIRPPYQREFIYKDKQRNEVIHTVRRGFPLNTMYWAVSGDGYELMDGQQRTVSLCQYIEGDFSVLIEGSPKFFHNLTQEQRKAILDYELQIYVCEGTESEKLDWFKIINIAGEKLTDQELRNAIYTGPWLTHAKRHFSKTNCPAYRIGDKYLTGSPIRQEYLEKALEWISGDKVEDYMSVHQHDPDAQELWQYFQEVVAWVERVFPQYRSLMKGRPWGTLFNQHRNDPLNANDLEARIVELIEDDEVTKPQGIYEYLLTGNEKYLSLRAFDKKIRQKVYEKQKGKCPVCKKTFSIEEMEADHIIPWHEGGKTELRNCQMLCRFDNRSKGGR